MKGSASGPLVDVRVLDLTENRGLYATKMLADFGADGISFRPE